MDNPSALNTPDRNRARNIILLIIILIVAATAYLLFSNRGSKLPKPNTQPTLDVQNIVNTYLQAKEDRVGADRTTTTSWLNDIKPVVTSGLLDSLQPKGTSPTSNVPYNYTYAHNNDYIVRVSISNCKWSSEGLKPTSSNGVDHGVIICKLVDETVNRTSQQAIPPSSLQFGWPYSGQQQSPVLGLVKQNGHWLIEGDATGNNR